MAHGPLKLFTGSAHPALAREIAEYLGLPPGGARLHRFPDSEVSFQIDENIRGADVGWTMNTSVPRMFSSIWNETSVSGNRWRRAIPSGIPRCSAISFASAGWALPENSFSGP